MESGGEERDDCFVVTPSGRIDSSTVAGFMETLLAAVHNAGLPVVVDLREVPFVTSAALRVFIIAQRELARRGQRLVLRSPVAQVARLLSIAGLDALLEVRP